jgi:hypothetical protein
MGPPEGLPTNQPSGFLNVEAFLVTIRLSRVSWSSAADFGRRKAVGRVLTGETQLPLFGS